MANLKKEARGPDCQVRIPSICNFNPETTVLAHYRLARTCGGGMKLDDKQVAWSCGCCHDAIDSHTKPNMTMRPCAYTTPRAYSARKPF
jgi:hypothetical protein